MKTAVVKSQAGVSERAKYQSDTTQLIHNENKRTI